MNTERDKFLTEQMGECWHEFSHEKKAPCGTYKVCVCGRENYIFPCDNTYFSTWDGFGKLWEWAQKQPFWMKMIGKFHAEGFYHFINPGRFADAVYEFLKR